MFGAAAARALDASGSGSGAAYAQAPIGAADFDMASGSGASGSGSAGGAGSFATDGRALDLLFIMDATGSMGSYIREATKNIETICDNVSASC